mmetsp:Transcript_42127/g.91533  ORF Transcript_42127/g.91533 Transcript_42127/m.91533 type:complete len:120 (-) Transcript_42127:1518-1877(-)
MPVQPECQCRSESGRYPVTHVGRAVAIISVLFGLIFTAILTAAVYAALLFTSQEHRTMNFIINRNFEGELHDEAATVLQMWFRGGFSVADPKCKKAPTDHHLISTSTLPEPVTQLRERE